MILIITHKEDFTADFVIEKLNKHNIKYFRLNCEDLNRNNYSFDSINNLNLSINGICDFSSVWFRRTKLPDIEVKDQGQKMFLLADYESLFDNLFSLIKSEKWLSIPHYVYRAENKLYQLQKAKQIGFNVPNTIVTNSYKQLSEFILDNDKNVIIKPIRQGRIQLSDGLKTIFTNQVNQEIIENLTKYDLTPCIFQNNVLKEYELRITVVANKVFSAKINSQENENTQIDWRKEKIPFTEYELPLDIQKKCVKLLKELNISFGAIDLIKDKNGKYIFLEINPNGQWAWIEMETGLKISKAIINYLTMTE